MQVERTALPDVLLITPKVFPDPRGYFIETFSEQRYAAAGVRTPFVQDNHSHSTAGVLRGLHFQLVHPQTKLVSVVRGEILDVAVDVRVGSPTFGRWVGHVLSDRNHAQMYIPDGFAHGFCVLSPEADVAYKCTEYYDPTDNCGLLWSDPAIAIAWPVANPLVSEKDALSPRLADIPRDHLPVYRP